MDHDDRRGSHDPSGRNRETEGRNEKDAGTRSASTDGMRGEDRAGDQGLGSSATKQGIDGSPRSDPDRTGESRKDREPESGPGA